MTDTVMAGLIRNETVMDLVNEGKTQKDVAAILGCSKALVSCVVRGVRKDPEGQRPRIRVDVKENVVFAMIAQGMTQSTIASHLECSTTLIATIVNRRRGVDNVKGRLKKLNPSGKMCSNCGGELEKGQTMLCLRCYTENSEGARFNTI